MTETAANAEPRPADEHGWYAYYVLALLWLVYVFNFVDRQVLAILLEPIKKDLGASDTAMGFLSGFAFALFYTVAGIPIARWADRGTRRTIITIGLALWSGMTALSGMARGFVELAAARVGVGIGEAAGSPPAHSLLSDYFPPHRRATALGIYAAGVYVGVMLAFVGGGYVATHFTWRTAFLLVGLPGLPLAALVRLTVREPARTAGQGVAASDDRPSLGEVLRFLASKRSFVFVVVAAAFNTLAGYAVLTWGASFLRRVHAMPIGQVGTSLGLIVGIGGTLGSWLGGVLADRLGQRDPRWYGLVSAIVSALGVPFAVVFLLAPSASMALVAFTPYYVLAQMYIGAMLAVTQGVVTPRMRATASAVVLFVLNLFGLGLGPLVVGALNDTLKARLGDVAIRYSLLGVVAVSALSVPFFLAASRFLRADLGGGEPNLTRGR